MTNPTTKNQPALGIQTQTTATLSEAILTPILATVLAKAAEKAPAAQALYDAGFDASQPLQVPNGVYTVTVSGLTVTAKDATTTPGTIAGFKLEAVARILKSAGVTQSHMLGVLEQSYEGTLPELSEDDACEIASLKERIRLRLPRKPRAASLVAKAVSVTVGTGK